jgi:hypothetical protein
MLFCFHHFYWPESHLVLSISNRTPETQIHPFFKWWHLHRSWTFFLYVWVLPIEIQLLFLDRIWHGDCYPILCFYTACWYQDHGFLSSSTYSATINTIYSIASWSTTRNQNICFIILLAYRLFLNLGYLLLVNY